VLEHDPIRLRKEKKNTKKDVSLVSASASCVDPEDVSYGVRDSRALFGTFFPIGTQPPCRSPRPLTCGKTLQHLLLTSSWPRKRTTTKACLGERTRSYLAASESRRTLSAISLCGACCWGQQPPKPVIGWNPGRDLKNRRLSGSKLLDPLVRLPPLCGIAFADCDCERIRPGPGNVQAFT